MPVFLLSFRSPGSKRPTPVRTVNFNAFLLVLLFIHLTTCRDRASGKEQGPFSNTLQHKKQGKRNDATLCEKEALAGRFALIREMSFSAWRKFVAEKWVSREQARLANDEDEHYEDRQRRPLVESWALVDQSLRDVSCEFSMYPSLKLGIVADTGFYLPSPIKIQPPMTTNCRATR